MTYHILNFSSTIALHDNRALKAKCQTDTNGIHVSQGCQILSSWSPGYSILTSPRLLAVDAKYEQAVNLLLALTKHKHWALIRYNTSKCRGENGVMAAIEEASTLELICFVWKERAVLPSAGLVFISSAGFLGRLSADNIHTAASSQNHSFEALCN